ncbi:MAG: OmpW family protein [Proteobacteria bacterium]|jgi:outer membrane protein|nr:OmpW family protein [Pseudomonadota bacterium]
MKNYQKAIYGLFLLSVGLGAQAHEAGDVLVRVGLVNVSPNEDVGELQLDGAALAGTGGEIGNSTQLLLTATYMLSGNVGLELLAASPFEHDIRTTGLENLGLVNGEFEAKHLPPTLTLLWYPAASNAQFQPFIGAGLNYTLFFSEDISDATVAALGADNLNLDSSFGLAFRAGFDVDLNESWGFNAGVWYLDIDTELTVDTALGQVSTDVKVDPWVIAAGLNYRF